ncbi:hypothetical protein B0H14DRAFT_3889137 [Mycena olivaceomarginata]|nr:hypothetical protein B0H14DRAFT_3889137 [Mycena olivaceomarginata]
MPIFINVGGKFGPGKGRMYLGEPHPNYSRSRALYLAAHVLSPGRASLGDSGGVSLFSPFFRFDLLFVDWIRFEHCCVAAPQRNATQIVSSYESDTLSSVAWYLHALCVRAPFETAGENLAGVLARVLAAHRQQQQQGKLKAKNGAIEGGGEEEGDWDGKAGGGRETGDMDGGESEEGEERDPPRVQIDRFRMELVLLHTFTPAPQTLALVAHAAGSFAQLVSACTLPEELIVRVVCVAQGVVWAGQMLAPPPGKSAGSGSGSDKEKEKNGGGEKGAARRANRYARANRNRDRSAPAEPTTSASGAGVQNDNERAEGKEKEGKQKQRKTQAAHLAHLLGLNGTAGHGREGAGGDGCGAARGGGHGGKERRGGRRGGEAPPVGLSVPAPGPGVTGGAGPGKPELAERRVPSDAACAGGHQQQQRRAEEAELGAQREPFWATYAEFLRRLARAFSAVLLPKLSASVREGGEGGEGKDAEGPEGVPLLPVVMTKNRVWYLTEKMKATLARRERPAPP